MKNFIFTHHAAQRWFERFGHLNFQSEIESAERSKQYEKRYCKGKSTKAKAFFTKSKAVLICKPDEKGLRVVTCLSCPNFMVM